MSRIQFSSMCVLAILSLFIVACSTPEAVDTPQPTAQPTQAQGVLTARPPVGLEPTATVPAPSYREPSQPITLDNVADIEYLGRLDSPGRKSTVFNWSVSPDGIQLVALNNDLLSEWNLVTSRLNFSTSRGDVTLVFYSPDKEEIYGVAVNGVVLVYQSITGEPQTTLNLHPEYSGVIAYDNVTGRIAIAGTDGTIKIWDLRERSSLVTFPAHDDTIVDLAFSHDGLLLASTGTDGIIKLWAWETETEVSTYDLESAVAFDMVFSPDDTQLAVSTQNFVAIWNVLIGELAFVLQTGTDTADEVLKFSPDSQWLLTAGETGNMRLWNTDTSNLEIELPEIGGNRVSGAFSTDALLLVTTVLGQDASLWNLNDITERTVARAPLSVPSNNLFGVEWTRDGYSLIFFDATGDIFIWGVPANE